MELKTITISFKQTPEELALYNIINRYSSKGAFIKDVLISTLIRHEAVQQNLVPINFKELFGGEDDEITICI